jgi:hypothetical protein
LDLTPFQNLRLEGGFVLVEARLTAAPLLDPVGRTATAETVIRGRNLFVSLRADLDERELSISLYHEILEAATVATDHPPAAVIDFNEGDFEKAAKAAHDRWGNASPSLLNLLLAGFGFRDQGDLMKRNVELILLKLADGGRLLRLSEQASGLCLEKRLNPAEPVAEQKQRWNRAFHAMLDRELGAPEALTRNG